MFQITFGSETLAGVLDILKTGWKRGSRGIWWVRRNALASVGTGGVGPDSIWLWGCLITKGYSVIGSESTAAQIEKKKIIR
jgi:hypothetical protein